jgi:hypothetical protein
MTVRPLNTGTDFIPFFARVSFIVFFANNYVIRSPSLFLSFQGVFYRLNR